MAEPIRYAAEKFRFALSGNKQTVMVDFITTDGALVSVSLGSPSLYLMRAQIETVLRDNPEIPPPPPRAKPH